MGGMGPAATVDFISEIVSRTPVARDQDHIPMIILHNPGIPDRQTRDEQQQRVISRSLRIMAESLEKAGADFIALPCNTAHIYIDEARLNINIPILHIVDETVKSLAPELTKVAILGTTYCVTSELYQNRLASVGKQSIVPTRHEQAGLMKDIYKIKQGRELDAARDNLVALAEQLIIRGAEAVIAACTELPLVLHQDDFDAPLLSSTAILADSSIRTARA